MEKHKDPAFLFYPESFLVGVMDMTDEEVGQYIRLMCRQHQKGHLPSSIINKAHEAVREKFVQDDEGRWYNERLELEIQKRAKWTASRRRNLEGNKDKEPDKEPEKKTEKKESLAGWIEDTVPEELVVPFLEWARMRSKIKKPITSKQTITRNYNELCKLSKRIDKQKRIIEQSVDNCWRGFYPLKESETPYSDKPKEKETWEKEDFVPAQMPAETAKRMQELGFGNIIGKEQG
jgi:hypothetical protein